MTPDSHLSALELLEQDLAGLTGKEQFDALAGAHQLWWLYCQRAARSPADPGAWQEARERVAALAWTFDPAPDDGHAFIAAANALADIAYAMAAAGRPGLSGAVAFWHGSGLFPRRAAGDALPADLGLAMTSLVERLLDDPAARLRGTVQVPVLFDRPRGGGVAGWLEISELPAGPAGLYPDPRVMSFTRAEDAGFSEGLARAWEYARTHSRADDRCLLWRLRYEFRDQPVFSIGGGSLGAAFAIAAREVLAYPAARRPSWTWLRAKFRGPRPGCAVTGVLGPDEALSRVSALAQKLAAAQARRWRVVAPAASRTGPVRVPAGVRIYWASNLTQARRFARRWRPVRTSLALGVLTAALAGSVVTGALVAHSNAVAQRQRDMAIANYVADEADHLTATNQPLAAQLDLVANQINPTLDNETRLINTTTTPLGHPLTGPAGIVNSVAFSPDMPILAAGSDDGKVWLWNLADPAHLVPLGPPLTGPEVPVESVAFSPDGRTLAAGTDGGEVWLWNLADPGRPAQLGQPLTAPDVITSVAFSPDGQTLAAGTYGGEVWLWTVADPARPGQLGQPLTGPADVVDSVAFSPDGRTLAAGSEDSKVWLWNLTDPARPARLGQPLTGPTDFVNSVVFSRYGRTLAAGTVGGEVWLWNLTDPARPARLGQPLTSPTSSVNSVAFSPDGRTLAVGSENGKVWLWNLTDPASPHQLGQPVTDGPSTVDSVAFSPDGRTLAAGTHDHAVQLWQLPSGVLSPPASTVDSVAFSPDRRTLAGGSEDGSVWLWNLADPAGSARSAGSVTGPEDSVNSVAFSPDGRTLAAGSNDSKVWLWTVANPAHPTPLGQPLTGPTSIVSSVAFSPDGRTLAVGSWDNKVWLWNITHLSHPTPLGKPLTGPANTVYSVAFSPDRRTLAAGSEDGSVWLWNVAHPAHPTPLGHLLTGPTSIVSSVAFSPDGRTLAAGSWDSTVWLWNVANPAHPTPLGTC